MNVPGQAAGTRIVLLTVVVVVGVLKVAEDVFVPLALALLLTFMLAPLVEVLQRVRVNRTLGVIVSLAIALTLFAGLGDLVVNQVTDLARSLPNYQSELRHRIVELRGVLRIGNSETTRAVEQITRELQRVAPPEPKTPGVSRVQVVQTPQTALETLGDVVVPLLRPLGTAFVVIVLVAFLLMRLHDLRERVIRVLGARNLFLTTEALDDAGQRISRYLLMQILINGWTGLCVTAGLWYLGVPNAALWGVLTLLLRFIPYVGCWAAAAMPFILSFAAFEDWTRPIGVVGLFAALELFNYVVLEPWLYGSRTGLSPVALLLAAAFWTWVWGLAGLFLAVPLTVCVVVMGKYIPQLNFLYVLLGDQPVLEPHQRLYQRLLRSGRDQADSLLEEVLRSNTMLEVCDSLIVPTVQLVESDFDRGALTPSRRKTVLQHVSDWAEERLDAQRVRSRRRGFAATSLPSVICIPADDKADDITAKLLAAALLENGIEAWVAGIDAVQGELTALRAGGGAHAAVVSALPPNAVAPARTVCKQIHEIATGVPVFVGLWRDHADLQRARERLESAGAQRVLTSFADCLTAIRGVTVDRAQEAAAPPHTPLHSGHHATQT
jgi:predicted PurR-regulated permease PerM